MARASAPSVAPRFVVAHATPSRAVRRVLVRQLLRLRPGLAAYVARSGADR